MSSQAVISISSGLETFQRGRAGVRSHMADDWFLCHAWMRWTAQHAELSRMRRTALMTTTTPLLSVCVREGKQVD